MATLDLKTRENFLIRKAYLQDLGIDVLQAYQFMNIFYDLMQKQKVRFGMVHHSIIDEEEYYLHFEAVADNDVTQSVLNEFDQCIAEHMEYFQWHLSSTDRMALEYKK